MKGKIENIVDKALQNTYFRQVLETGKHTQIVIMSIKSGEDIGEEIHEENDQVLFAVEGKGKVILDDEEQPFERGDIVLVRAGVKHNFVNDGSGDLKIITTYSPAHHPQGTIHETKEDASKAEY